ncbi:MAG TPA: TlpA disulfide reductase family protein [Bryobacteraceae bacterium]|jgi:peroxiredoxin|nr:TlpA disulfide reductase family protein [Bryobacteraceae bacterium]
MLGPGDRAPKLDLVSGDGRRQPLEELWSGAAVVLAVFKISCPVCQLTLPILERISGGALRFVAVSQDNAASSSSFALKFRITFPVLLDPAAGGYPVSNALGVSSVPSIFVIETDGIISKSFAGFSKADIEELGRRANAEPFLAGENVPQWKAG